MFFRGVPTKKDGDKRDESRTQPSCSNHAHGRVGVHEVVVVKRFDDGVEPIKGDCTEMKGAYSGGVDIN